MGVSSTSFRPGVSGNPNGRPKGWAAKLRVIRDLTTDETLARVWEALLREAEAGDVQAIKEVLRVVIGTATLADESAESGGPAAMFQALVTAVKEREHNGA